MDLTETTLNSKRIYEGRIVCLRVDDVAMPGGRTAKREVVEHSGAVAMVALLPGPQVILVRQFRYPAAQELLEIPAGTLEENEEPVECARRELMEETGYAAGEMAHLVSFYTTPGFATEKLHVFLATDLSPASAEADEDEEIETSTVGWAEAIAMCLDGRICDAKTIAGILAADRLMQDRE